MNKPFYFFLLLVLLVVAFVGGARFNQHGASQPAIDSGERRILHYVDPMNPANTSKEPGIAPCGMPMEPVYADEETFDGSGGANSGGAGGPGVVKIKMEKQQIIGVQLGKVTTETQTPRIRALGRIVPDENKVYALVAATDGWMGEIHESTTGSLVSKNQLLGKIRVYDYDFFTWQQRYLTELGNAGRRRVFLSPLSGAADQLRKVISTQQQAGSLLPDIGAPIALPANTARRKTAVDETEQPTDPPSLPTDGPPSPDGAASSAASTPWGIPPGATRYGENQQSQVQAEDGLLPEQTGDEPLKQDETVKSMPPDGMDDRPEMDDEKPSRETPEAGMHHQDTMASSVQDMHAAKADAEPSQHVAKRSRAKSGGLFFTAEDDILYASKARQELLDLGVVESQLAQLAESGVYFTYVELRSPVDGLVLVRNVSTRQRIARGTECFRVADLSRVWVETDIYDIEAQYIQPGMQAVVSSPRATEHFSATVSEVLPRYDAVGRSLKVRLVMDNPEIMFRPDMFVDVEFLLELPKSMTVPSAAVIDSGKRKTVYVAVGEGLFEPRQVLTGWRFNDRVEIVGGLRPGEEIVVSGNFLIDSESRMKLAAARLMDDMVESSPDVQALEISVPPAVPRDIHKTPLEETVKDPVCGMNINPAQAEEAGLMLEADGQTYYFCSEECAEEFHRHGPQISPLPDSDSMPDAIPDASADHAEHQPGHQSGQQTGHRP
jgi:RND family efflux transporter MFP subunit